MFGTGTGVRSPREFFDILTELDLEHEEREMEELMEAGLSEQAAREVLYGGMSADEVVGGTTTRAAERAAEETLD